MIIRVVSVTSVTSVTSCVSITVMLFCFIDIRSTRAIWPSSNHAGVPCVIHIYVYMYIYIYIVINT